MGHAMFDSIARINAFLFCRLIEIVLQHVMEVWVVSLLV